ncbi:MAG: hypothetical protein M1820_004438 [Bogoriella megaspora]|nr:MAG: hypothetical protein M1820_004438 [Bogoriella megaspora]
MSEPVFEVKCSCNEYPWGKQGSESESARLCAKQPGWDKDENGALKDFKIDENKVYSEMWFGTYPVLPTYVKSTGEDLQDLLDKHPDELVGKSLQQKFGHTKLPYLPKVLSISKALPLQLHPNKEKSAELHKKDPEQFTDPNHKPEIAIALSKFEAFCGWKPIKDIEFLFNNLEPLRHFLPQPANTKFTDDILKQVTKRILLASEKEVKDTEDGLLALPYSAYGTQMHIYELLPRLQKQYDATDPGSLVALLTMNYLVLQPGDAIYIPADGIHAYLSGDIIECMARSNNVLNTGFCPRADRNSIDIFTEVLTFTPHNVEECLLPPKEYQKSKTGKSKVYAPPLSEFDVVGTTLESGDKEVLGANDGPGLFVVTKGSATLRAKGKEEEVKEGSVWFVAPGVETEFEAGGEGWQAFRAYAE